MHVDLKREFDDVHGGFVHGAERISVLCWPIGSLLCVDRGGGCNLVQPLEMGDMFHATTDVERTCPNLQNFNILSYRSMMHGLFPAGGPYLSEGMCVLDFRWLIYGTHLPQAHERQCLLC